MVASFRGRGLLAQNAHKIKPNMLGCVFSQSSTNARKLQTGATFDSVLEWEHEWNTKDLLKKEKTGEIFSESSVQKGFALIELLKNVHDPIPTED